MIDDALARSGRAPCVSLQVEGDPMRRGLPFLLVAIVVLTTATSAQAIVYGHPDGTRHPFVGMVFQNGADAGCSGTLISPTVFVTAGHCTHNLIVHGTGAPD